MSHTEVQLVIVQPQRGRANPVARRIHLWTHDRRPLSRVEQGDPTNRCASCHRVLNGNSPAGSLPQL